MESSGSSDGASLHEKTIHNHSATTGDGKAQADSSAAATEPEIPIPAMAAVQITTGKRPDQDGPRMEELTREKTQTQVDEEEQVQGLEKKPTGPWALPPTHPMHPSQYPDGGLKAWLVVLGSFCCLFVSFGWINCIGVFQAYYQTHQLRDYPPSTVAWITSLETFMMFAGGPFIGKWYDNHGPRYILLTGTFFHVFGLMMASLSTELYQFILAQGICSPFGASCIFYAAITSINQWFWKKRGAAFGIVASGSSLGGVLFPIAVAHLVPEVGFPWTMRICAFIILALLIVSNLTVRSRVPPFPRPFAIMEFITPLTELPFLLNVTGSFLFFFGMFLPFTYIILQAGQQGMSLHLQEYLIPILNAASVFGRTIPGALADKVGRFNVQITMAIMTSVLVLALWLPSSGNAPIIVFAAFYGFGSGTFVTLAPAISAQISKDLSKIGVRNGTVFAIISIAALVGSPVGGAIITRWHGSFHGLQIFCGVMQIGGVAFLIAARQSVVGWKTIFAKV